MGTTVGDWQLKGKLGQGGFGDVQHWKNILTKQEIGESPKFCWVYVHIRT